MSDSRERSGQSEGTDAPKLRKVAAEIEDEFPLVARRTGLVLLDVDPGRLQAQWQVESAQLDQVRGAFPAGVSDVCPRLRLLRPDAPVGERQAAVMNLPGEGAGIEGVARFEVSDDEATYQVELGLGSADGGWLLLARSNRVRVPRPVARPIPVRRDPAHGSEWEDDAVAMDRSTQSAVPRAAREPWHSAQGAERVTGAFSPTFDPALADSGVRLAPVFPQPIRAPSRSPATTFLRVVTALDDAAPVGESVPLPVSSARAAAAFEPASSPEPASGFPGSLTPAFGLTANSGGAGNLPSFPPYDPGMGVTSAAAETRSHLEMRAELLVYGRGEPGTLIQLFGQNLRVGANGRFFLRRALEGSALPDAVRSESPASGLKGPETE